MNQNTSVDNDLQKAIDDITKTTNSDPLFSDPVAGPAPAPVGPFPVSTPAPMPTPRPTPRPSRPAPAPMPKPVEPAEPVSAPVEDIEPEPASREEDFEPAAATPFVEKDNLTIDQVEEAALRELAPILPKLDVSAEEKYDIYQNVIDDYHDTSVLGSAYHAATEIRNEHDRGEALLHLYKTIKKIKKM